MLLLAEILYFYSLATFKGLRSYLTPTNADTPKITKHSDYALITINGLLTHVRFNLEELTFSGTFSRRQLYLLLLTSSSLLMGYT